MIDKNLIHRKISNVNQYLKEIREINIGTFEEFEADVKTLRFFERNIELIVTELNDICKHILSKVEKVLPKGYNDCFEHLENLKILKPELAEIAKKMIGYRNMLAHEYEYVISRATYNIYQNNLGDIEALCDAYLEYVESN